MNILILSSGGAERRRLLCVHEELQSDLARRSQVLAIDEGARPGIAIHQQFPNKYIISSIIECDDSQRRWHSIPPLKLQRRRVDPRTANQESIKSRLWEYT